MHIKTRSAKLCLSRSYLFRLCLNPIYLLDFPSKKARTPILRSSLSIVIKTYSH